MSKVLVCNKLICTRGFCSFIQHKMYHGEQHINKCISYVHLLIYIIYILGFTIQWTEFLVHPQMKTAICSFSCFFLSKKVQDDMHYSSKMNEINHNYSIEQVCTVQSSRPTSFGMQPMCLIHFVKVELFNFLCLFLFFFSKVH